MYPNGSITNPTVARKLKIFHSRKCFGLLSSKYLTVEGGGLVTET